LPLNLVTDLTVGAEQPRPLQGISPPGEQRTMLLDHLSAIGLDGALGQPHNLAQLGELRFGVTRGQIDGELRRRDNPLLHTIQQESRDDLGLSTSLPQSSPGGVASPQPHWGQLSGLCITDQRHDYGRSQCLNRGGFPALQEGRDFGQRCRWFTPRQQSQRGCPVTTVRHPWIHPMFGIKPLTSPLHKSGITPLWAVLERPTVTSPTLGEPRENPPHSSKLPGLPSPVDQGLDPDYFLFVHWAHSQTASGFQQQVASVEIGPQPNGGIAFHQTTDQFQPVS
jgi:hypothetical protein